MHSHMPKKACRQSHKHACTYRNRACVFLTCCVLHRTGIWRPINQWRWWRAYALGGANMGAGAESELLIGWQLDSADEICGQKALQLICCPNVLSHAPLSCSGCSEHVGWAGAQWILMCRHEDLLGRVLGMHTAHRVINMHFSSLSGVINCVRALFTTASTCRDWLQPLGKP